MKKGVIIVCVILLIIIVGILFVSFFPSWFWKRHAIATENLQVKLKAGENDLEYQYGQDERTEVAVEQIEIDDGTGASQYTVFYPAELNEQYPVVVWGNGTGNTYQNYEPALRSLASYGFVVIGCDNSSMGSGETQYAMGLYAKELANDEESLLYGHIDSDRIGVAGHSQGACGAVNAATKFEESSALFSTVYTTSLPKLSMCVDKKNMEFAYWAYDVSEIKVPYFATTGTRFLDSMWISPLSSMQENFTRLDSGIEAIAAREIGANHNIINEFHGDGYFNAWFCYTLKDDMTARKAFSEELEKNTSRWKDVIKQNIASDNQ